MAWNGRVASVWLWYTYAEHQRLGQGAPLHDRSLAQMEIDCRARASTFLSISLYLQGTYVDTATFSPRERAPSPWAPETVLEGVGEQVCTRRT